MSNILPSSADERLASLDEDGNRIYLHPAEVKGPYRNKRNIYYTILLVIFFALPWIQFNGRPFFLLHLVKREFTIFGLTLYAHDGPMLLFLLIFLAFGMAYLTAVWGRVWCGWACPQTVFIDHLYRTLEMWIEGKHFARKKLEKAPWNFEKIYKKFLKWGAFIVVSWFVSNTFLAYFVGTDELLQMMQQAPSENMTSFLVMMVTFAIVLFDFGWFREQFCIIMCPYGRFQSVLQDPQTINVMYDEDRGEPRKGSVPQGQTQGDCVNCRKCIQVCPTGIDIRKGSQMECVACSACIDACDEVMETVKKPKGLIRYKNLENSTGAFWRKPRAILYMALMAIAIIGITIIVAQREPLHATILRAKESPYTAADQPDGSKRVVNHFRMTLHSQSVEAKSYRLDSEDKSLDLVLIIPENPIQIPGNKSKELHFFAQFNGEITRHSGQKTLWMSVIDEESGKAYRRSFSIVGPTY